MRRSATTIALALTTLLAALSATPADAAKKRPKPPCNVKGATTVVRGDDYPTSKVVVTTTRAADEDDLYDSGARTYWGCISGSKATKLLTTTGRAIAHIRSDYAVIGSHSYDSACTKYGTPPDDDCSRERVIVAANLKTRTITYTNTNRDRQRTIRLRDRPLLRRLRQPRVVHPERPLHRPEHLAGQPAATDAANTTSTGLDLPRTSATHRTLPTRRLSPLP